ncbi:hypothetical protein ABZ807_24875 [Micromonospora sp. NPDC047548]|uniref:hypothetical protein n=1 Tax=Micromonospora sp. NPDC047548 TaxID=3155624 RepID=UPI0033C0B7F0
MSSTHRISISPSYGQRRTQGQLSPTAAAVCPDGKAFHGHLQQRLSAFAEALRPYSRPGSMSWRASVLRLVGVAQRAQLWPVAR